MHGESLDVDDDAIKEKILHIMNIVTTLALEDVWNAYEFGLFIRHPQGWMLFKTPIASHKKKKTRLTFIACCEKNGSEKMPFMAIGSAQRQCAFNRNCGQDSCLDKHANMKAWMNAHLFHVWLYHLDQ